MSLNEVWEAAAGSPFDPLVPKERQFLVGITSLFIGLVLTGLFGLNRSFTNLPLLGIPAALAFSFGSVYMICAVGVFRPPISVPRLLLPKSHPLIEPGMDPLDDAGRPLFTAVSSSAKQLFQLLRCISFAPKTQVRISKEGLRFTVEDSRVMQGLVFLEKSLFSSYIYSSTINPENGEENDPPLFQISLSSLLETLQIFGINDVKDRWSARDPAYGGVAGSLSRGGPAAAFENKALGMTGMCRLSYIAPGDPLCIILEETGVTTTCELVTYEPEFEEEIPLQLDALAHKIIMRASWLYDAISELSSTSPTRLTIVASPTAPCFTLSSNGPLGSATVEFSNKANLLETFEVPRRTVNTYKFSLIKGATRAMAIASKVSIRADEQGVLSLQFMIEVDTGGVSFVDFHFVPFEPEDDEESELVEVVTP